ncbi:UvrD-helicase domain-containing protein [Vibrio gazogenes]|uniref:DNA 3'-5' helicase II n=1 Tax=Vibrio gazogenes DSM 21264 = NBRC 103151 TaxID=1123492 RepID=A0A1M5G1U3_VIBGA|nr:UvrD-helicase domain-containing protein [Vibrio gazogenes]USP14729.1 UvrD-helicase domain-containing protein [Vibrio gazogenes]SHF97421.1 Superfamily I DNA or RNA helicase [Vibrio gazogenes DSM 21264] [Vibrio gazogenes DSM 21264 = NBRC 103151]SJN59123.1 DNA-dependent helicase II [Vibrio gazogenes]
MIPSITDIHIDELQAKTGLTFDQERRKAIKEFNDIQACPGSGKTTLIAAKLILLAKSWKQNTSGICVLSHTNVAKNEIVSRLESDEYGRKLLSYPHFIGTIQEFVNRFLALPFCRSKSIEIKRIDDEVCFNYIDSKLSWKARRYLDGKPKASISNLQIRYVNGGFKIVVPGFKKTSTSDSYKNLYSIKKAMMKDGVFFYREMFEYAKAYLDINPNVIRSIRSRFPLALVDEMQDTSFVQDEIINKIFSYEGGAFQRLGDSDQAIFSGGEEDSSNSYNDLQLQIINTSHRFNPSVANLASRLSTNKVKLISSQLVNNAQPHTIYIVDEQNRPRVLSAFAQLCGNNLPLDEKHPIKAVGGIGKTKPEGLTIKHYFSNFDKSNSSKNFKPDKMIEYFRKTQKITTCNSDGYKIVLDGIRRLFSIAGFEYIPLSQLKGMIKDSPKCNEINQKIIGIQSSDLNDSQGWGHNIKELLTVLGLLDKYALLTEFISYVAPIAIADNEFVPVNMFVERVNGRNISIVVDTIHAVKGETHSATLLLETKFHEYDVHQMLDYIIGVKSKKPTGVRKPKFMKQLYVAMTRPKHLIGIAIDKSRIPEAKRKVAIENGWNIVDLTVGN